MKRDVPEPWAAALVKAKLVDRRNGMPSMTALAKASGVHASTIGEMMYGTRKTQKETVDKVAAAIFPEGSSTHWDRRRRDVHRWVGRALGTRPFEPHPDADLLDAREQWTVNELIRLLALSKRTDANNAANKIPTKSDYGLAADDGDGEPDVGAPEDEDA